VVVLAVGSAVKLAGVEEDDIAAVGEEDGDGPEKRSTCSGDTWLL
jgi:hypothetical protein